jgi:RNA polymerase sigma-70 factor (ECF subfamily)
MDDPAAQNSTGEQAAANAESRTEEYLRLLTQNDRWLAAYVYSLVHSQADAQDILQDCKIVMWKQFQNFTTGTNFRAWARKIVTFHILNYRRSQARHQTSELDEAFIEAIAAEIERNESQLDRQAEALQTCLRKLPEAHRKVILLRYYEDQDIDEIAAKTNQTAGAVYRLLSRIRKLLNECVQQQITTGRVS